MFTLLECVSHFEMAGLADGLDDGEPQAVGVFLALAATVEAVEEALGIQSLSSTRVGNAQCSLLYVDIDAAMGLAMDVGIAQEVAHERSHQFVVGRERP